MQITEHIRFTGKSYQIMIEPEDNLNPIEIGECFVKQYPKELAVIVFKEIQIKLGIMLVGLKLGNKNYEKEERR